MTKVCYDGKVFVKIWFVLVAVVFVKTTEVIVLQQIITVRLEVFAKTALVFRYVFCYSPWPSIVLFCKSTDVLSDVVK